MQREIHWSTDMTSHLIEQALVLTTTTLKPNMYVLVILKEVRIKAFEK